MKKIICIIASCAIFALFSCSQPKTVIKDTNTPSPTEVRTTASTIPVTLTNQELARELYEATHNVKLSDEKVASIFSSNQDNLLAWQKVLENYSGDSKVDISYIQNLITGMKGKL